MKTLDLGKEKINKLLLAFALPCVVSMLINSVYNIVDQIFIGKGVGTVGNAATNVIFPLVLIFGAVASLIGNGASAHLSLKLGEGNLQDAKNSLGSSIVFLSIVAVLIGVVSFIFLPILVEWFGSTETVYPYALSYGRVIAIGAPFVILYTGLASIIRADGSPKYSMMMLVVGAIINIVLDPIFIFGLQMGVVGGALATVIGQVISCVLAVGYFRRFKSFTIKWTDLRLNRSIFRILSLGLSSFITQMTILVLFVFMNNMLTRLGVGTKFGADIPLSVYGIISKINSLYISTVLGIAIGSQPIIGYNYGARNYERVRETLRKVLLINFICGIIFNLIFVCFPKELVSFFITTADENYDLFMEFAVLTCRSFMMLIGVNALEITTSIVVQSLGHVVKATLVSFARQILLFIPIACFLSLFLKQGLNGILYAGPIADSICFVFCIFLFSLEYQKLSKNGKTDVPLESDSYPITYQGKPIIITISREYGSGGHYVGELLAKKLGLPFYDKEIIRLSAKESGFQEDYVAEIEEKNTSLKYENNNDDQLFIAEKKVILNLVKQGPCVIVGRCADFILKDYPNVLKIFLYSNEEAKIKRAIKYYGLKEENALKEIRLINKQRAQHYKHYTNQKWDDWNHYDLLLQVDSFGVFETADYLYEIVQHRNLK